MDLDTHDASMLSLYKVAATENEKNQKLLAPSQTDDILNAQPAEDSPASQTTKIIMTKKTKSKAKKNATTTEAKRPVGRPSAFPAGTNMVPFPSKVSEETVARIREMSDKESGRKNPFGLPHNSIGAELHRIVEAAHKRFVADRDRRGSRRKATAASAPAQTESAE